MKAVQLHLNPTSTAKNGPLGPQKVLNKHKIKLKQKLELILYIRLYTWSVRLTAEILLLQFT